MEQYHESETIVTRVLVLPLSPIPPPPKNQSHPRESFCRNHAGQILRILYIQDQKFAVKTFKSRTGEPAQVPSGIRKPSTALANTIHAPSHSQKPRQRISCEILFIIHILVSAFIQILYTTCPFVQELMKIQHALSKIALG